MIINALREIYPLKKFLETFHMAKSSYCYQKREVRTKTWT